MLSHLRFGSVTQRPQHIATGLASTYGYRVLFVEEPIDNLLLSRKHIHIHYKHKDLAVFTPYMKWDSWDRMIGFYAKHIQHFMEMVPGETLLWFYSPHYVSLLDYLEPDAVVYDCMDELSAFLHASADLPKKEKKLIKHADVIFTGGTSLYEQKSKLHPLVFNFPSSVDRNHFIPGRSRNGKIPKDIAAIPQPVAGYYGVIDERLDIPLITEIADRNPHISWVYIGPVVKINPSDLPKRSNIYFLGAKEYSELPYYLKAVDVAIMPFAINKATTYISPTKTLEFMSANKPIVSTPIRDVVRHFSEVVHIANNSEAFSHLIHAALNETEKDKKKRISAQNNIVKKTSWSNTILEMTSIIKQKKLVTQSQFASMFSRSL
jgi:glycosyltransferase involved in cell wall biosynthesis